MSNKKPLTDCGATFEHDAHLYKTSRGKVKACDGSTTKRTQQSPRPSSHSLSLSDMLPIKR